MSYQYLLLNTTLYKVEISYTFSGALYFEQFDIKVNNKKSYPNKLYSDLKYVPDLYNSIEDLPSDMIPYSKLEVGELYEFNLCKYGRLSSVRPWGQVKSEIIDKNNRYGVTAIWEMILPIIRPISQLKKKQLLLQTIN